MAQSTITIQGKEAFERKLAQLKTEGTDFEKRLRSVIRKIMGEVRANLSANAKEGLGMKSDPRHAYKAVRYAVYKKILGGQENIISPRRAGSGVSAYQPARKGSTGRGGNRRTRSERTQQVMGYEGRDRGFILRFLNDGMTKTRPRKIQFTENTNRKIDKWNKHPNTGNRGSIAARNWFGHRSQRELERASARIQELIDKIINDEFV